MFSKKQLVIISLVFAILFHFAFYFYLYGTPVSLLQGPYKYILAMGSSLIMIFIYFGTYWRNDLKGNVVRWVFDLLIAWIFICFFRSLIEMRTTSELIAYMFNNYMGLSLFPVLFFIAGINARYFIPVNRTLSIYFFLTALITLLYIKHPELQHWLLLFIFYMILTIPLRSYWGKFGILLISIIVVVSSLTNRAEIIRVSVSYLILATYYLLLYKKLSKKLLYLIVVVILLIPAISLYLGVQGQSVFQMMSGDNTAAYSQLDPYADTRTFLYYEVFQDLRINDAFLFGKGLNAGYYSETFETFSRSVVEVGFLQIILKTGILGFLLYITVIISSITKALKKSNNLFIKAMGLMLSSYVLMLFIENIIAYNLLNVVVWVVVGMCNSETLRKMSNMEIKSLFNNNLNLNTNSSDKSESG